MKNRIITVSIVLALLFAVNASAQSRKKEKAPAKEEFTNGEMKTYYLVLLKKGPKRDQDSAMAEKIQQGHMDNINKMAKEGKLAIAGPIADGIDLRGIFIFDVRTKDEVQKLVEQDPAVISGRLIYEIYPWMSMRGAKLP